MHAVSSNFSAFCLIKVGFLVFFLYLPFSNKQKTKNKWKKSLHWKKYLLLAYFAFAMASKQAKTTTAIKIEWYSIERKKKIRSTNTSRTLLLYLQMGIIHSLTHTLSISLDSRIGKYNQIPVKLSNKLFSFFVFFVDFFGREIRNFFPLTCFTLIAIKWWCSLQWLAGWFGYF